MEIQKRYIAIFMSVGFACLAYIMQRYGLLLHGPSYYLPLGDRSSFYKRSLLFRNIFYTFASMEVKVNAFEGDSKDSQLLLASHEIEKVILYPHENITIEALKTNSFEELRDHFTTLRASHLYEEGEASPFVSMQQVLKDALLRGDKSVPVPVEKRTTLVLFPGILSEFISHSMFDDIFEVYAGQKENDPFYQLWKNQLDAVTMESLKTDKVFSLEKLSQVENPLHQILDITSLQGISGLAEFNVVRFNSPMGSLETLGSLEKNSVVALRRLGKFFRIMDVLSGPIVFIGYSRGVIVALETLRKARRREDLHPWSAQLTSLVSVAGPIYGSEIADAMEVDGHMNKKVLDLLVECTQKLDYSYRGDLGSIGHAKEIASNTKLFLDLAVGLGNLAAHSMHPEFRQLKKEFTKNPDIHQPTLATIAYKVLFEQFHFQEPVEDYYGNVKTFKILINALVEGLRSMTYRSRLDWWRTNLLPANIKYYSLACTMPDASPEEPYSASEMQAMLERDISFDDSSLDYRSIRTFFYDLYNSSGVELNDGQIPVSSAVFWPHLVGSLNPKQTPLHFTLLGVLGCTHWSVAMPFVFDKNRNRFPRTSLLKSIASFIEMDHAEST